MPTPVGTVETTQDAGASTTALNTAKSVLDTHFEILDWEAIDIIAGVAAAHYVPGEMLWMRIIGPSRSGKTEILRALAEHADCEKMEGVTPAAIRGGLRQGTKLLEHLDGKLVITKEIASLLTTRREDRTQVFGLLRGVKDGELVADFGTEEGRVNQKAWFDWILAATQFIEQQRVLEGQLGSRFVDLRWRPGDREEAAYQAAKNNANMQEIRVEVAAAVGAMLDQVKQESKTEAQLEDADVRTIAAIANLTALFRTPVQRDQRHQVAELPEPEFGTDLAQTFSRLALGLRLVGLEDFQSYLERLFWDCMTRKRAAVVKQLANGLTRVKEIAEAASVPDTLAYYELDNLKLLGLVEGGDREYTLTTQVPDSRHRT